MGTREDLGLVGVAAPADSDVPLRPGASLWQLFATFLRIGAFTVGGGYVMVPLIQKDIVDRRGWISREDFIDLLAITQTAPGPLAVNTSIYVGYVLRGITGALVSAGGCILPSIVAILVVAALFTQISSLHLIHAAFRGIRPAVVILIVSAALRIGKVSVRSLPQFGIAAAAAILVAFFRVSPALVIVIAALAGLVNDGGGKT